MFDQLIEVFVSPIIIDGTGMVVGILRYENRTIKRQLHVCGRIIIKETPVYMEEYALQWAVKMFREYIAESAIPHRLLYKPAIYAGSEQLVYSLREWRSNGNLRLISAAAPDLIEEIHKLDGMMGTHVIIRPHPLKEETEDLDTLPAIQKEQFLAAEEFRVLALPVLGGVAWTKRLPRVPLTKEELKEHIRNCMHSDELSQLRKLKEVGSESAKIIVDLELTRGHVKEAMRVLKHNHEAQVTLASILCGTRFKHAFQSVLVPTECPNKKRRKDGLMCGAEDSFEHLVKCHGLQKFKDEKPYVVDLLVRMAKRSISSTPGISVPKYIV